MLPLSLQGETSPNPPPLDEGEMEVIDPAITIKSIGHQWYWSYEYSDFVNEPRGGQGGGESLEFDSYLIPSDELELGQLRLLEVDNRVIVPVNSHIRFIVTGADL